MEQLTQAQLAELIRAGYKKHNLKETNADYYDEETHAACPIFAAYSFFFESAEEAEAEFLSDEYFEQWYQNVLSKLQAYEG